MVPKQIPGISGIISSEEAEIETRYIKYTNIINTTAIILNIHIHPQITSVLWTLKGEVGVIIINAVK